MRTNEVPSSGAPDLHGSGASSRLRAVAAGVVDRLIDALRARARRRRFAKVRMLYTSGNLLGAQRLILADCIVDDPPARPWPRSAQLQAAILDWYRSTR